METEARRCPSVMYNNKPKCNSMGDEYAMLNWARVEGTKSRLELHPDTLLCTAIKWVRGVESHVT